MSPVESTEFHLSTGSQLPLELLHFRACPQFATLQICYLTQVPDALQAVHVLVELYKSLQGNDAQSLLIK